MGPWQAHRGTAPIGLSPGARCGGPLRDEMERDLGLGLAQVLNGGLAPGVTETPRAAVHRDDEGPSPVREANEALLCDLAAAKLGRRLALRPKWPRVNERALTSVVANTVPGVPQHSAEHEIIAETRTPASQIDEMGLGLLLDDRDGARTAEIGRGRCRHHQPPKQRNHADRGYHEDGLPHGEVSFRTLASSLAAFRAPLPSAAPKSVRTTTLTVWDGRSVTQPPR